MGSGFIGSEFWVHGSVKVQSVRGQRLKVKGYSAKANIES
jgi:hypothetical protein